MPKLKSDDHHLRHLGGKTFMAAVSPWFFTVRAFSTLGYSWRINSARTSIMVQIPGIRMYGKTGSLTKRTLNEMLQWVYRGDDWLFVRRWEQLIARRNDIDIVQVISWNGPSSFFLLLRWRRPHA